ncbi:NUDIX hydrolase [Halostreptopolyspora alba]|uniref:NUDIX domain-containing protein n=1 Tax=Halostreptopolyspora alba TaxID=2487137 RepID=A0A3N0ECJ2_9ACTN|nr:NUDIX domain-containing protein [Nocardiopsaceae bacterium YIM 96095]
MPDGVAPPALPISIKGVVAADDHVLVLRNERDEWELPGGKLELDETPEQCLAREIAEETGWPVRVGPILDAWTYHITSVDRHVFIVTYSCYALATPTLVTSPEHKEAALVPVDEVNDLTMPEGYKRSITTGLSLPGR